MVDATQAAHPCASLQSDRPTDDHSRVLHRHEEDECWLAPSQCGGIEFRRVFKPNAVNHEFGVNVLHMKTDEASHFKHVNRATWTRSLTLGARKSVELDLGFHLPTSGSDHHPNVTDCFADAHYCQRDGAIN